MIKIMFRVIDWKVVWWWIRLPIFFILLMILGLVVNNCTPEYPFTPVSIPQESEFKDPLAIDHKQRESVNLFMDKYGKPEIMFAWAGDDFKVEVLRWKKPSQKHERWAIRINNIYKFTWTQFNIEKEKLKEVKK